MRIRSWLCLCSCIKNHWTCPENPAMNKRPKQLKMSVKNSYPKTSYGTWSTHTDLLVIRLITYLSILSTQKVKRCCRLSFVSSTWIPDTLLLNLSTISETLKNKTNLPGMIRENDPVNHKKSELVLRVFKRILENLLEEEAVLIRFNSK